MVDVAVVGYSVRNLARSALASGIAAGTLDGFGDRDLCERSPRPAWHQTLWPFVPAEIPGRLPKCARIAWTSNLENHADVLESLGRGRTVIGNGADVVRRVRKAELVEAALHTARLAVASTVALASARRGGVLVKPRSSGGGHGVRPWEPGMVPASDELLQERIDGTAGSLVFAADGNDIVPLGLTRQLNGDPAFGATGFGWCGNLAGPAVLPRQDEVRASAQAAAAQLTREFGLRGINGIDFIERQGEAVVIEVNPRWTASVELFERAGGVPLFPMHVAASEGRLEGPPGPPPEVVVGKAVVYARRTMTVQGTDPWFHDPDMADIPASGSVVPAGAPICTVLARGSTAPACLETLRARARAVQPA